MEVLTPPCISADVIIQTFNYDNLQKYLEYLLQLDKKAIEQIFNLHKKMEEITDLKQEIVDMNFKLERYDNKFDEMNKVLNNHQIKLIDVEKQAIGFQEVTTTPFKQIITFLEKENVENKKKILLIDDNLNNLNRISVENCKNIDKINGNITNIMQNIDIQSNMIASHDSNLININNELGKQSTLNVNINSFKEKSLKRFEKIKKKVKSKK